MAEDVKGTASLNGDVEPLLPDGWEPGDDIFADAKIVEEPIDGADEFRTDKGLDDLFAEEETEDQPTPTTTKADTTTKPDATAATDAAPDGEKAEAKAARTLKLKVNHQDKEVDLNSMTDEDIIAIMQKGYAFDAMKDEERKKTYRQVYQEQVDAGMTEHVAKLVAREAADGNTYALEDETPTESAEEQPVNVRDLQAEVAQLRALYPDFKEMPDDVAKAVAAGAPLLSAYIAHREKQSAKTAASLKKENEALKQNAASAAKAPVSGVSGSGTTYGKPKSKFDMDFEKGFNAGTW